MLKVNPHNLTTLRYRFDGQVSEADILTWLYNFDEADWAVAMTLLNHVSFYSETRCADVLEDGLKRIIDKHRGMPIAICPIGGVGKSGGVMAYHIKKLMRGFRGAEWSFVDGSFIYQHKPYVVILLDDFVGSGRSACGLYDSVKESLPDGSIVMCLCVAYMQKAAKLLIDKGIKIYGEEHFPAFTRRHSVFGYPPRMKCVREFAEKYGALLYPKKPYVEGMQLYIGPLGYANCQSLVCFDHTTPNNTLPILWESKMRLDNNKKWMPLFPRRLYDRTQRDDSYEHMKYKWISIAQKISKGTIKRFFNDYSKSSILLMGLLHGKFHKRSDAYICTMLEITHAEYEALCVEAIQKGLLKDDGQLTVEGKRVYLGIRKKEFEVQPLVEEQIEKTEDIYLPQQFLGFSRVQPISEEIEDNDFLDLLQSLGCE